MAEKKVIDEGWGWEKPFGFSQAVRAGDLVFLSGQMPVNTKGELVCKGDLKGQARQIFENMKTVLSRIGLSLDNVVEIVSYHTNMEDLNAMVEVKAEYLPNDFPAWTVVGVVALALPGQMLEIKAIAVAH